MRKQRKGLKRKFSREELEILLNPLLSEREAGEQLGTTYQLVWYYRSKYNFNRKELFLSSYREKVIELFKSGLKVREITLKLHAPPGVVTTILIEDGLLVKEKVERKPKKERRIEKGEYTRDYVFPYKDYLFNEIKNSAKYLGMTEEEYRKFITTKEGEKYCYTIQGTEPTQRVAG